jgi:hypothetical protein
LFITVEKQVVTFVVMDPRNRTHGTGGKLDQESFGFSLIIGLAGSSLHWSSICFLHGGMSLRVRVFHCEV